MTPDEVRDVLLRNVSKRVRVTFEDGVVQNVDVSSVDSEGFVHSGPDGEKPDHFWTRFESVTRVDESTY
jgi:hypothetical protein